MGPYRGGISPGGVTMESSGGEVDKNIKARHSTSESRMQTSTP